MKVAVLMGSPRKKDSFAVCRLIEQSFPSDCQVEFEYIFIKNYNIEDCKGCDQCFMKSETACPCKDDLPLIKEKLVQADGIIFASPVYACQITGTMKKFIDRLSYLFHRQELVGKPTLTVITTKGGGIKPTAQYLKMTACGWGCHLVAEISIVSSMYFKGTNPENSWGYSEKYHNKYKAKIQDTTLRFHQALISDTPPVPSFYDIYMFQGLRSKTFVSKADYDFWEEREWLNSNYFYDVPLSPLKLIWGRVLRAVIDSMVRKYRKQQGTL